MKFSQKNSCRVGNDEDLGISRCMGAKSGALLPCVTVLGIPKYTYGQAFETPCHSYETIYLHPYAEPTLSKFPYPLFAAGTSDTRCSQG